MQAQRWPTLANQAEYDERSGSRKMPLSQVLDGSTRLTAWNKLKVLESIARLGELIMQRVIYHQLQTSVKLILIALRGPDGPGSLPVPALE